jgi:hypothetical protein
VKQVGSGKATKMVEEAKVDTPAINALRGLLEDLAKETGGRVRIGRLKHEYPDGVPGETRQVIILPAVTDQIEIAVPAEVIEGEVVEPSDNGHSDPSTD